MDMKCVDSHESEKRLLCLARLHEEDRIPLRGTIFAAVRHCRQ